MDKYKASLMLSKVNADDKELESTIIDAENDRQAKKLTTKHFHYTKVSRVTWHADFYENIWYKQDWFTSKVYIKLEKLS